MKLLIHSELVACAQEGEAREQFEMSRDGSEDSHLGITEEAYF